MHLYLDGSLGEPLFLNSIIKVARANAIGTSSSFHIFFKRSRRSLPHNALCLYTSAGILSSPHALPLLIFASPFMISLSVSVLSPPFVKYSGRIGGLDCSASVFANFLVRNSTHVAATSSACPSMFPCASAVRFAGGFCGFSDSFLTALYMPLVSPFPFDTLIVSAHSPTQSSKSCRLLATISDWIFLYCRLLPCMFFRFSNRRLVLSETLRLIPAVRS